MALTVDRGLLQSSISVKLPAGFQSKFLPPAGAGRLSSRNAECLKTTTRKIGVVYSAQSDVQTKELVTTTTTAKGADNGSSIERSSSNGRVAAGDGPVRLQAKITIRKKRRPSSDEQRADFWDVVADGLGQKVTLELVSVDVDPETGVGKRSGKAAIEDWVEKGSVVADKVQYTAKFHLTKGFGIPGAIIMTNSHQNEFFLESVSLVGHPVGTVHFPTHSWVHAEQNNPAPSVFFSNQVYLPSSTPKGLHDLREEDLKAHRGDGKGERQKWENVYDYDVYNDLGDGDKDMTLSRPTLGGSKDFQYPRRNRTGRPRTKTDPSKESRMPGQANPYVPRDEDFEPIKQENYFSNVLRGLVQQYLPDLRDHFRGSPEEFDSFEEIDSLYNDGVQLKKRIAMVQNMQNILETVKDWPLFGMLPDTVKGMASAAAEQPFSTLVYPSPQVLSTDRFAWIRDDEFARQSLAGINPCAIELLEVFPPLSALDNVDLYGPKESAITEDHIKGRLEGLSVDEALKEKRLFILDFHDVFIPYITRINAQGTRKGYASRTLFFLKEEGTLTPLAIELSLAPPNDSRQVFVPGDSSTQHWLWKLAKAHVSCNDAGYHQLVSHWVRTHASAEPYVIATNRQLSPLHPIFKLLHPHSRYTMEINAAARQSLICSAGVIENSFLPGRYSMEMSSKFYGGKWRFDTEALPEELISRGLAEKDQTSETGLKLLVEDYPFANDGLLVWAAIESWVSEYVSIYYKSSGSIQDDDELQNWWEEIRTQGHADKKDEDWWPLLKTDQDLIRILTTVIWVSSGLHAAVNFGQYDYAGYMPNKPTLMRRHIPQHGTPEYAEFLADPQLFFLKSLPSQVQSTVLMAVIESLSTHSPDEEYLGSDTHPNWFGCPEAVDAFKRFQKRIVESEKEIHRRNEDPQLRNRNGAAILPYELLLPWSKPGITARGIPNSISI